MFSQENVELETSVVENQINTIFANFIAGSLFDKVEIVKSVEVDSVPQTFFEEALNFAVSNKISFSKSVKAEFNAVTSDLLLFSTASIFIFSS